MKLSILFIFMLQLFENENAVFDAERSVCFGMLTKPQKLYFKSCDVEVERTRK